MLLLLLFLLLFASPAWAVTYYASPSGSGSTCSQASPCTVATVLTTIAAGDTLYLLDGTYTGNNGMLALPDGRSGTQQNPIIVRALNDGQVHLNGQFGRQTLAMSNNDWWIIEGINVYQSSFEAISLFQSDNNILRRVCAWHANPPSPVGSGSNLHTMLVWNSADNLFEDICLFGYGRNNYNDFQAQAHRNVMRRAWIRWSGWELEEGFIAPGPAIQTSYGTGHDSTFENIIINFAGDFHVWGNVASNVPGYTGMAYRDGAQSTEPGNKLLGAIMYGYDSAPRVVANYPDGFFFLQRWVPNTIRDLFVDAQSQSRGAPIGIYCDRATGASTYTTAQCGNYTSTAERITSLKTASQHTSDFETGGPRVAGNFTECTSVGSCPSIYTGTPGAGSRACYRYQNSLLTSTPLWPWPMDDRIKAALAIANATPLSGTAGTGYAAGTVTSEIVSRYGSIPAECTGEATPPPPPSTYYVATTGSDSNTCTQAKSQGTPKLTLNNVLMCAAAGDTVQVANGTYNECLNDVIPSGLAGTNTILRAANAGSATIRPTSTCGNTSAIYLNSKNFITIDGFVIDLGAATTPINDGGIWLNGSTSNVTISNVEIKNMGTPGTFGGCGVCIYPNASSNTVRSVTVHDFATSITDASKVANCFDVFGTSNLIEDSVCHHVAYTGYNGFNNQTGTATSNNVFRNNIVHHTGARGVFLSSGAGNSAYNNVVYQTGTGNSQEAVNIGGGSPAVAASGTLLRHNTIYNNTGTGILVSAGSGAFVENNIVYSNGGGITNSGSGTTLTTNFTSNPGFTNPGSDDYTLPAGAAACDQGTTLPSVTIDKSGASRPKGSVSDPGAYECPTTPAPPVLNGVGVIPRHRLTGFMGLR